MRDMCDSGNTIWNVLASDEQLSYVYDLYTGSDANISAVLDDPQAGLTVFVPWNNADLTAGTFRYGNVTVEEALTMLEPYAMDMFLHNTLPGRHMFKEDPGSLQALQTLLGAALKRNVSETKTAETYWWPFPTSMQRTASFLRPNFPTQRCDRHLYIFSNNGNTGCLKRTIEACNGVVQVMDGIVLPNTFPAITNLSTKVVSTAAVRQSSEEVDSAVLAPPPSCATKAGSQPSMWDVITRRNDTSIAVDAILESKSGLDVVLNSSGLQLSMFIPEDDSAADLATLLEGPVPGNDSQPTPFTQRAQLLSVLLFHMTPGRLGLDTLGPNNQMVEFSLLDSFYPDLTANITYMLGFFTDLKSNMYGVGGTGGMTSDSPITVTSHVRACNGDVFFFNSGSLLPPGMLDNITSIPRTYLEDAITPYDVRWAMAYRKLSIPESTVTTGPYAPAPAPLPSLEPDAAGTPGGGNGSSSSSRSSSGGVPTVAIAVPIVAALVLALVLAAVALLACRRGRRGRRWAVNKSGSLPQPTKRSRNDLEGLASNSWVLKAEQLKFVRQIGQGSFGTVSLGKLQGAPVAIKCLHQDVAITAFGGKGDDRHLRALAKEVNLMTSMRSPYIVMYLGVCLQPLACVTEFCANGSLYDVLARARSGKNPGLAARLTWQQRLKMALEAALGMAFLHSKGVLHRDLKSHNLLVDEHLRVKVGDFGLSELTDGAMASKGNEEANEGGGSTIQKLNRRWMAPEVAVALVSSDAPAQPFTKQSDVYSYGLVLLELMTYRIPFHDLSDGQVMLLQGRLQPSCPPMTEVVGGAFQGLPLYLDLLSQCWVEEPSARPCFEKIATTIRAIMRASSSKAAAAAATAAAVATDQQQQLSLSSTNDSPSAGSSSTTAR